MKTEKKHMQGRKFASLLIPQDDGNEISNFFQKEVKNTISHIR
jgi:hypothetical protein